MLVEISKGELIDKITILEIKNEKIVDPEKLINVCHELETILKLEFPTPIKEKLMEVNRKRKKSLNECPNIITKYSLYRTRYVIRMSYVYVKEILV